MFTSKGFLEEFFNENDILSEDFNLEESVDVLINEECGDITIGDWAFLQEGDVDDIKFQLLENILYEIDTDLLEADKFFEGLLLTDEDNEILNESLKSAVKKGSQFIKSKSNVIAKAVSDKAKVAAKAVGEKSKIAAEKLKVAAKAASAKSKEYALKARDLAKKGAKDAADKAKNMASKMAAKARELGNKIKEIISKIKFRKAETATS